MRTKLIAEGVEAGWRDCEYADAVFVEVCRDEVQLITAANNALAQNITVPDGVEAIAENGNIILTGARSVR